MIITAPGSALDEIHREPAKLVSLYFDCMSAPVWRMGGGDAAQRDAACPVIMQRQGRRGDRLDRAEAFHWRAAWPCHCKPVDRIPDNFLPKTCGGLMMENCGTGERPDSD